MTETPWRRWLAIFLLTFAGGSAAVFGGVVLLDPYSTGRLTPFHRIDIAIQNRLYANAGRVRDQRFDAAIVGNSHAVRIDPARVSAATGQKFVLLAIEGTYPREHHFLMRMFQRQHRNAAYVLVLDELSCRPTTETPKSYEVPRWLYEGTTFDYLSRILSPASLRAAIQRARILLGQRGDAMNANGYDPRPWQRADLAMLHERMLKQERPVSADPVSAPLPLLEELAALSRDLDPQARLLLVFTPVYRSVLPVPGSAADARIQTCKTKAKGIAAARPRSGFLDLRVDNAVAGNSDNFIDGTHYVDEIARDVENKIAEQLKLLGDR